MINKRKFIPEGVEDINFKEYEKKEYVQSKLKEIFKSFGYRQALTPTFEYYDLFNEVDGTIDTDEMYKMIDLNGKILVLRPDVTIPIARMVATNYDTFNEYLKFMYMTNVYRISDYKNGGKREFVQAGIEYLCNSTSEADAEVISIAIKSLLDLGIEEIKIDISQAKYFSGIANNLDITMDEKINLKKLIENKNFAELRNLLETMNIDETYKNLLLEVPYLYGNIDEIISKVKNKVLNKEMEEAVNNLMEVYKILKDYGYEKYISVDLGLINHIDYYSGVIFKGYIDNYGKPIISGGRYDNLSMQFGKKISATGFGINIDELMEVINKSNILDNYECNSDYLILYSEDQRKKGISIAGTLRENNYIVETDLFKDMNISLENAKKRNIKNIIIINAEKVKIIDVKTNKTYEKNQKEFLDTIK